MRSRCYLMVEQKMRGVQRMNREEFILTLRKELSKLPPEEIVAATEYFEECFEEAAEGLTDEERLAEEQRLIKEFGNPKRIAAQIKADYAARLLNGDETVLDKKPGTKKKLSAVWWVVIGICTAPVSIPLAIGAICVAIWIICAIIGIYAGIIGGGMASIGAIVLGIVFLTSSGASGVMTIGAGLVGLAVTAAAAVGAYIGTKALVKAIARGVKNQNSKRKTKKYSKMYEAGEMYAADETYAAGETYEAGDDGSVWVRTDTEEPEYYEMVEPETAAAAEVERVEAPAAEFEVAAAATEAEAEPLMLDDPAEVSENEGGEINE